MSRCPLIRAQRDSYLFKIPLNWPPICRFHFTNPSGLQQAVSPIVHARSAQVGIGERESRRGWGQQLVVRGQLHSPMVKLVMCVAHVAPIRARCFNSKRTSFHVALELEHVESVDLRSAIRKADAVLPAFARAGQRGHTLKRGARRGRCRLLFRLGVQHICYKVTLILSVAGTDHRR